MWSICQCWEDNIIHLTVVLYKVDLKVITNELGEIVKVSLISLRENDTLDTGSFGLGKRK